MPMVDCTVASKLHKYIIQVFDSTPVNPDDPNVIHIGIETIIKTSDELLTLIDEAMDEWELNVYNEALSLLEFQRGQLDLNLIYNEGFEIYTLDEFFEGAIQ